MSVKIFLTSYNAYFLLWPQWKVQEDKNCEYYVQDIDINSFMNHNDVG